jgi:hypothetical protein
VDGGPGILAEVERLLGLTADTDDLQELWATTFALYASLAPDPLPEFRRLVEQYEAEAEAGRGNFSLYLPIQRVLRATRVEALWNLVLDRLAKGGVAWNRYFRREMLRAMVPAGSATALRLLEEDAQNGATPGMRTHAASDLLELVRPDDCELARAIISFTKRYGDLDLPDEDHRAWYGSGWTLPAEALANHNQRCGECLTAWAEVLLRIKRSNDPSYRDLLRYAPRFCKAITGVESEDDQLAWLAARTS